VIGTVDSFIFALGNRDAMQTSSNDLFQSLARTVIAGHKAYDTQKRFWYAGQTLQLGKSTLIIVDEAQDLVMPETDAMFKRVANDTGTDVYLIGDKLQSIWGSDNAFVRLFASS
jgi:hypothetical protein